MKNYYNNNDNNITAQHNSNIIAFPISNAETSLWRAVLLQAFIDLRSNSKKKIAKTYRMKSAIWFNLNNNNFVKVCYLAGYEPKFVYHKADIIRREMLEKEI